MNILGIETSCDETAASIVRNGTTILSNVVASSLKDHIKYGGIIPEIASRRQIELINAVAKSALEMAGLKLKNIHAIAVTQSPGLIGSLLVGISYARALCFAAQKPLIEVDHIKAHLYANFLNDSLKDKPRECSKINLPPETTKPNRPLSKPLLPAIGLVVSGGHSCLYYIKDLSHFELLGQTRDDALGETFDKVAKILNLGYPGGPIIDRLALKGEKCSLRFPCAELPGNFDFSFSGIKTAILYYQQDQKTKSEFSVPQIAYAFQESVISVVVKKCLQACFNKKVKTLLVGGGVAANSMLRKKLKQETAQYTIDLFFPPTALCLDNAAMIAGLGYHLLKK